MILIDRRPASGFAGFADYVQDFNANNFAPGTEEANFCNKAYPYRNDLPLTDPANKNHLLCRTDKIWWPRPHTDAGRIVRGLPEVILGKDVTPWAQKVPDIIKSKLPGSSGGGSTTPSGGGVPPVGPQSKFPNIPLLAPGGQPNWLLIGGAALLGGALILKLKKKKG